MHDAEELLSFWLTEVGEKGWYTGGAALNRTITERYQAVWEAAQAEGHLGWCMTPRSMLALLILLDQFPRNMFRGTAQAYATDPLARRIATRALDLGWDRRLPEPERQFFYTPLLHSECLGDQERCVRLIKERMPDQGATHLLHARAHREVIRRYGRFPHRNAELGRPSTPDEQGFLDGAGYRGVVEGLTQAA